MRCCHRIYSASPMKRVGISSMAQTKNSLEFLQQANGYTNCGSCILGG